MLTSHLVSLFAVQRNCKNATKGKQEQVLEFYIIHRSYLSISISDSQGESNINNEARDHILPYIYEQTDMTNSVASDKMPHFALSDRGLHCLPLTQQFYIH